MTCQRRGKSNRTFSTVRRPNEDRSSEMHDENTDDEGWAGGTGRVNTSTDQTVRQEVDGEEVEST